MTFTKAASRTDDLSSIRARPPATTRTRAMSGHAPIGRLFARRAVWPPSCFFFLSFFFCDSRGDSHEFFADDSRDSVSARAERRISRKSAPSSVPGIFAPQRPPSRFFFSFFTARTSVDFNGRYLTFVRRSFPANRNPSDESFEIITRDWYHAYSRASLISISASARCVI